MSTDERRCREINRPTLSLPTATAEAAGTAANKMSSRTSINVFGVWGERPSKRKEKVHFSASCGGFLSYGVAEKWRPAAVPRKRKYICACVYRQTLRGNIIIFRFVSSFFYSACLYKRTQLKPKASKSLSTAPSHALKAPSRNMPAIKTKGQGKEKKK